MTTLEVGTKVIRIGSQADSNVGRTGDIVEIDETANRYRVRWTAERSGRAIRDGKGLRTWVQFNGVAQV